MRMVWLFFAGGVGNVMVCDKVRVDGRTEEFRLIAA